MMRELSQLLSELHDGLGAIEDRGGVRLTAVEMTLPLDFRAVLRDGGCVLLADVARSRDVDAWMPEKARLTVSWASDGDSWERPR